jgi:hypothetical protein
MYYFIEERLIFQILLPYFNHVNVGVFKADFTKFIIDACISYAGLIIPGVDKIIWKSSPFTIPGFYDESFVPLTW